MELGLAGKVVVITGGATGIGKEAALAFLQEGCQVAVCSRSQKKVDSVVADCKAQGYEVLGRQVDAASTAELSRFADEVAAAYGGIDIWLNNAGVYPQCPLLEMTEEAWDEIFRINVKGVFVGSRIAASHMACACSAVLSSTHRNHTPALSTQRLSVCPMYSGSPSGLPSSPNPW